MEIKTEKKCENCKFWKPPNPDDWGPFQYDYGSCNRIDNRYNFKKYDPNPFGTELAHIDAGGGCVVELRTLPYFYCCLYEEKP